MQPGIDAVLNSPEPPPPPSEPKGVKYMIMIITTCGEQNNNSYKPVVKLSLTGLPMV